MLPITDSKADDLAILNETRAGVAESDQEPIVRSRVERFDDTSGKLAVQGTVSFEARTRQNGINLRRGTTETGYCFTARVSWSSAKVVLASLGRYAQHLQFHPNRRMLCKFQPR